MKFMQIEPQPARGTLREEMWDDDQWIAEEKYDGDRRIAQFCQGIVRFTGRRQSVDGTGFVEKTQNVPHLSAHFNACSGSGRPVAMRSLVAGSKVIDIVQPPAALDGTVLDGEMVVDLDIRGSVSPKVSSEGRSKFVTSIMGSLPEEAVRKQIERGWLRYVVFDCLFYKGQDVRGTPLRHRTAFAVRAVKEWGNPFVSIAESKGGPFKRAFADSIMNHGGEGVVLKHLDHIYGDKKLWVKVKKQATADVVIMGFKSAKEMSTKKGDDHETMTKYAKAGLIGAIICGQFGWNNFANRPGVELIEVATVSGMDDQLRRDLTLRPKKYIGRVIEIKHNGREPTGRFRHPRFKDFRSDKSAKDCVYREDET